MLRAQRLRGLLRRRSVQIPDRDSGTFGREARGNGKANAARRTRDDSFAAVKSPRRIHFGRYALV
jgi:hypothetical protein